jgi:CRISPR-associated endoribonuclease Cas6
MRFEITLMAERRVHLPIDAREYLTASIYDLIARADADYARFLHDEGYEDAGASGRRYKLFAYSQLRAPASRRQLDTDRDEIAFSSGPISWLISSPVEEFVRNVAGGLLAAGALRIAATTLPVAQIQVLPTPVFSEEMRFTCLSPIVAAKPIPKSDGGGAHFVRPADDAASFSEIVRNGLIAKFRILNARDPADARFEMAFDQAYLASHRGGTKLTTFKKTQTVGILAPFTAKGSVELMEIGWQAGLGSKTGMGHGMVEVVG